MRHTSFTIAFVLGLISVIPLACSDGDDNTPSSGGASGGGGKAGAGGTAGKAGAGGTAGKAGAGGTAGKGGSSGKAGAAPGEGGSGNSGNVAGDSAGEMGGDSAGGSDSSGAGSGGEGGQAVDPVAERLVKCQTIANYPAPPDGPTGVKPPMKCTGDADMYAAGLCDVTGWNSTCVKTLDDLLDCVQTADQNLFCCSEWDGTADSLGGHLLFDFAADAKCPATLAAWTQCLTSH